MKTKCSTEDDRKQLRKTECRLSAASDREDQLQKLCQEIEQDNKAGKTRDVYKKIHDITNAFVPRVAMLKNKNGTNQR